ncbi:hypothetical protein E3N88_23406 [Mikania micrantha]|uniref:NADP-dependent oxidoreductase domain-containing protein n=1 Tax=Mikania micrantha TaxID=192012 RepID=A0A5N6NFS5_9ASTR|nr:hypothetical protein E3N88_23406 [Mikania micrantha]
MATSSSTIEMPKVKLGIQGLEIKNYMGSECSSVELNEFKTYINIVQHVSSIWLDKDIGITFFDTADIYGVDFANETLIEKLLKELPRDKIQLATKFGIFKIESNKVTVKGTPEYARSCCEGSLKRLGVEYIDLFYVHRIDTTIPIEDTVTGSIWVSSKIEQVISRHCSICSCWPGFFGGKAIKESLPEDSVLVLYDRIEEMAEKHGCSTAQLALAWVLHQGNDVIPIPGKFDLRKKKNLEENIGSVKVKLTKEEVEGIGNAVPLDEVAGSKVNEALLRVSWKYANTPPKNSNRSSS